MTAINTMNNFDLKNVTHAKIFEGCQYPWEALDKIESYLSNIQCNGEDFEAPLGAYLVDADTIYISEDCLVEPGAYIQGPCYIGKGCIIRQGAYIRGNVIIGDNCVVGHASELKNCILGNNTHAAHFAYIGDSILGNDVNLGAGAKLANLRFDKKEIIVDWQGEKINTKRRKFGALIGDGAQIGCNAVTYPGSIIGANSMWYPCVAKGGTFEAGSKIENS